MFNRLRYERCNMIKYSSEKRPKGLGTSEEMFARLCRGSKLPTRAELDDMIIRFDVEKATRAALADEVEDEERTDPRTTWGWLRGLFCL